MLERVNSTTWQHKLPSGDYAYIGNPDSNKLEAHFKGTRFGGESGLGLGFPLIGDLTNITPKIDGDTFELSKGDYKVRLFPDNSAGERGGFEFEIVLGKKPPVNFLELPLDSQNLVAYHQPALTAQEIKDGANRPEDIVNSYAFYHPSKSGNSYQTGKAFHLKRAWARDALGAKTWLDQTIANGKWRVTDTKNWMFAPARVYPIVIGPTFGYTAAGASTHDPGGVDRIWTHGDTYTGAAGTGVSMSIHAAKTTTDRNVTMAVYDNASPSNLIANSNTPTVVVNSTTAQWWTATYVSQPTFTAVEYYPVVATYDSIGISYDSVGINNYKIVAQAYGSFPATISWSSGGSKLKLSIYATYTAAGGVTHQGSVTLQSSGLLSTLAGLVFKVGAVFSGIGSLSTLAKLLFKVSSTLQSSGSLTVDAVIKAPVPEAEVPTPEPEVSLAGYLPSAIKYPAYFLEIVSFDFGEILFEIDDKISSTVELQLSEIQIRSTDFYRKKEACEILFAAVIFQNDDYYTNQIFFINAANHYEFKSYDFQRLNAELLISVADIFSVTANDKNIFGALHYYLVQEADKLLDIS